MKYVLATLKTQDLRRVHAASSVPRHKQGFSEQPQSTVWPVPEAPDREAKCCAMYDFADRRCFTISVNLAILLSGQIFLPFNPGSVICCPGRKSLVS